MRKRKKKTVAPVMAGQYDATRWSPDRQVPWWPLADERQAPDSFDLWMLWSISRSLAANYAPVRMAVETRAALVGYLMPLPCSADDEWNELARAAFERRVMEPETFDAAGAVSWQEAQLLIQERAMIDGDHLTVLTRGRDGGGMVAFYTAPQLGEPGRDDKSDAPLGVQVDPATGRPVAYVLSVGSGDATKRSRIPAEQAVLYRGKADPAQVRGLPELTAVINDCLDLKDVTGFLKAAIKLSASVAIVEEKPADDARARAASAWRSKRGGEGAATETGESGGGGAPLAPFVPAARVAGPQMISLAPGRKLSLVHDTRPSNENQAFAKRLLANLAYNWGFDPEPFFFVNDLASAGARFSLQKMNRRLRILRLPLRRWCSRVYRHILACEMAAGRLPVPTCEDWWRVRWVPLPDLTIDRGREVAGVINAVREGLADADEWTLATEGLTAKQVLQRRAANLAAAQEAAAEYGVPLGNLLPGAVGAVQTAQEPEPAPEPEDGEEVQS